MFFILFIVLSAAISFAVFYNAPDIDLALANYFFYAPSATSYPKVAQPNTQQLNISEHLNLFFNGEPLQQGFFLKNHFLFVDVLHIYLKYFLIALAVIIIFQQILSYQRDHKFKIERTIIKNEWFNLGVCLLAIGLSTSLISLLKSYSLHACPWDLAIYNQAKALPWYNWQHIFSLDALGRCFPAGHSSMGFLFMHFALLCGQDAKSRDYLKRKAKIKPWFWLMLGLTLGWVLGIAQQMRGAHFLSHTMASMYIHLFVYGCLRYFLIKRHQQQANKNFIS